MNERWEVKQRYCFLTLGHGGEHQDFADAPVCPTPWCGFVIDSQIVPVAADDWGPVKMETHLR